MARLQKRPMSFLIAALVFPMAACDQVGQTPEATPKEEGAAPVKTFTGGVRDEAGIPGNRNPADRDRTMLVPATTLFPGSARVNPEIDNPFTGDAQAIAAGKRHFAAFNCAGCHAPLGGGGMGPPLSDNEWIYGGEPAQIYLSIMQGRPEGMPAFSSMLPQQTVWELVAYIETLPEIEDHARRLGFDDTGGQFGNRQGAARRNDDR